MTALRSIVLAASVALAACQSAGPPLRFPELTFANLPPYQLDVAEIEIKDEYEPPFKLPNVEHQAPLAPAKAAQRWAQDRLKAVGTNNRATVRIANAGIVENSLRITPGLRGVFTKDQAARYEATVEIRIEIRNDRGFQDAVAEGHARRSQTVPEDISPNALDQVWYELVEALMKDVNAELDKNIPPFMARFLR
jgi:hypothetical protein